jgi:hypothetical protein
VRLAKGRAGKRVKHVAHEYTLMVGRKRKRVTPEGVGP